MKALERHGQRIRHSRSCFGRAVLGAAVLLSCGNFLAAADSAYVRADGPNFLLGNRYLQRTITIEDGHPLTSQLENKLSGRTYRVSGREFQIEIIWERLAYTPGNENPWKLAASDFKLDGRRLEATDGGGKRLIFSLSSREREPALHVELFYEVRPEEAFTRQWLQLKTEGPGRLFIHYLNVASNEWPGCNLRLGGFGQPVYADDLFWGLEYPSGISQFSGNVVSSGSYVGTNVPDKGFTSQKAVLGVGMPGQVQQAFFSYIDSIRAQPVRPYVLYNTWYDLQRMVMTAQNTRQRATELNDILQKRYKLKLDSFVLDDGWDNMKKLWEIDATRFPNGFRDLTAALKQMGSGLGIWYGPVGGYDDRNVRVATGRSQGMEVQSNNEFLCLAGRHYSEYFEDSVLRMQKENDINFLKLDGVPFGCNEPDHGHPTGIYSREADERVFLDLLTRLRKQKPDVFLNITTGIWLSPWWLQYADSVWMGGEDSGYLSSLPTLSPRQSALSYRDSVLYDDFVRNQLQFPISSIMTHGIIRGKFNLLGGERESLADWKDELVHYVSVGNMMTELYISPELLNGEEWDALAATLHWAQANQHPLLDNTIMILGDPARREPYGFVHAAAEKVIVTLRNPFAQPTLARLHLDEATRLASPHNAYRMRTLYPFHMDEAGRYSYGDSIDIPLEGFEQRVVELDTETAASASFMLTGARYSLEDKGNGTATVHLYAAAGARRTIDIAGTQDEKHRVDIHFGKPGQKETVVLASSSTVEMPSLQETRLGFALQIPTDVPKTTFALLFEPESQSGEVAVKASDNGVSLPLTGENGKGVWQWFSFVLKPGTHNIQVEVQLPPALDKGGKLSAWTISEKQLVEQDIAVALRPGSAVILGPAASLPANNSVEKTTTKVLERFIR